MKTVLILAHPGHELRIFHWMENTQPTVSILTDGSGGNQVSRVAYSTASVTAAGATPGPIFGLMSDQAWYKAILARDMAPFRQVVDDIAKASGDATTVVTDAVDGYNPVHDLTSAIGAAVVTRLAASGKGVVHLVSAAVPGASGTVARELRLDDAAQERKAAAVKGYLPLAEEAQRILQDDPESVEREVLLHEGFDWPENFRPHWETFAKDRVDSGRYPTRITYADHVRPIALEILGRK